MSCNGLPQWIMRSSSFPAKDATGTSRSARAWLRAGATSVRNCPTSSMSGARRACSTSRPGRATPNAVRYTLAGSRTSRPRHESSCSDVGFARATSRIPRLVRKGARRRTSALERAIAVVDEGGSREVVSQRAQSAGRSPFDVAFTDTDITVTARVLLDERGAPPRFQHQPTGTPLCAKVPCAEWTTPVRRWGQHDRPTPTNSCRGRLASPRRAVHLRRWRHRPGHGRLRHRSR